MRVSTVGVGGGSCLTALGASSAPVDCSGATLVGFDLRERYLAAADFRGAYLSHGSFAGAALPRARFDGATLHGVDLEGAFLGEASFDGAAVITKEGEVLPLEDFFAPAPEQLATAGERARSPPPSQSPHALWRAAVTLVAVAVALLAPFRFLSRKQESKQAAAGKKEETSSRLISEEKEKVVAAESAVDKDDQEVEDEEPAPRLILTACDVNTPSPVKFKAEKEQKVFDGKENEKIAQEITPMPTKKAGGEAAAPDSIRSDSSSTSFANIEIRNLFIKPFKRRVQALPPPKVFR